MLSGDMAGLAGGLMQALLPAHAMAMISTALLAARAKLWPAIGFVVAAFAAGLAGGLAALALGVGESPARDVLLAAALLGGLAAAAALTVPGLAVRSTAFVVGLALGLDSPPDAILLREAVLGLIGAWCAGVALLVAALAVATPLGRLWNGIALRVAGSWLAATATLVLALRWVA
jgi:urease accessory protein